VEEDDQSEDAQVGVMEVLMASTPAEYHEALGAKETEKQPGSCWSPCASAQIEPSGRGFSSCAGSSMHPVQVR